MANMTLIPARKSHNEYHEERWVKGESVWEKLCLVFISFLYLINNVYQYRLLQVSAQKPLSYHKHMSGCIGLFFFSFSRTIEGSTEGPSGFPSFWFWAHFRSCLCCRAFRILPCLHSNISAICWQRAGSCGGVAHDRKSKSVTCQPWMSPDQRGQAYRDSTAANVCSVNARLSCTIYHVSVPFSLTLNAKYRI